MRTRLRNGWYYDSKVDGGILCPKCGDKTIVIKDTHIPEFNETYRKRRCQACKHSFYTVEFEVEYVGHVKDYI